MTDASLMMAFVAAAAVLTLTPGVDTAMVLNAAMGQGWRAAAGAAAGVALGCGLWGVAVALGLGAVISASPLAYAALKWLGAAYLVWLGVGMWRSPRASFDVPSGIRSSDWRLVRIPANVTADSGDRDRQRCCAI